MFLIFTTTGWSTNPHSAAFIRPGSIHAPGPPKIVFAPESIPNRSHANIESWPYSPEGSGVYSLCPSYPIEDAEKELRYEPKRVRLRPIDAPYEPEELEPLFGLYRHIAPVHPPPYSLRGPKNEPVRNEQGRIHPDGEFVCAILVATEY